MKNVYSESSVLSACLDLLSLRGILAYRNNSGAALTESGGKRRFIRYGLKGSSDIIGVLPGTGRFLAVECKRPAVPELRQRAGTLRGPQYQFLKAINEAGGVGVCVSDVGELGAVLTDLAVNPLSRFDVRGGRLTADTSAPDEEENPF